MGKTLVTSPIPLVLPSRNKSRDPTRTYSGRVMKRNVTTAFSFVCIQFWKQQQHNKVLDAFILLM